MAGDDMITYIEKGKGLHKAIKDAGHTVEQIIRSNGSSEWISSDDIAVQAIIDSYDELADAKKEKREELAAEWLLRIRTRYPQIDSRKEIKMFMDLWDSSRPAATINPRWQFAVNLETAFDNARATINGYTTLTQVRAYNVVTMPTWPV